MAIKERTVTCLCSDRDRKLRLGLYKCPNCGAQLEIFSDEVAVGCYECGDPVYRDGTAPPCIDWCASARQCLEEESHSSEQHPKEASNV